MIIEIPENTLVFIIGIIWINSIMTLMNIYLKIQLNREKEKNNKYNDIHKKIDSDMNNYKRYEHNIG